MPEVTFEVELSLKSIKGNIYHINVTLWKQKLEANTYTFLEYLAPLNNGHLRLS